MSDRHRICVKCGQPIGYFDWKEQQDDRWNWPFIIVGVIIGSSTLTALLVLAYRLGYVIGGF